MVEFRRKQIKKLQADDGGKRLWIGGNKSSVSAPCAEHDAGIAARLPKNRVNGATDFEIGCGVSPGFRALRHGLQRRSTCLRLAILFVTFSCRSKKKLIPYGAVRGSTSSVAYGATFPIRYRLADFVKKMEGKGSRRVRLFSFGKKNKFSCVSPHVQSRILISFCFCAIISMFLI